VDTAAVAQLISCWMLRRGGFGNGKLITHECSIETWALEEAKRRLQAEGTLPEDDA